jgi:hypothetical protein
VVISKRRTKMIMLGLDVLPNRTTNTENGLTAMVVTKAEYHTQSLNVACLAIMLHKSTTTIHLRLSQATLLQEVSSTSEPNLDPNSQHHNRNLRSHRLQQHRHTSLLLVPIINLLHLSIVNHHLPLHRPITTMRMTDSTLSRRTLPILHVSNVSLLSRSTEEHPLVMLLLMLNNLLAHIQRLIRFTIVLHTIHILPDHTALPWQVLLLFHL